MRKESTEKTQWKSEESSLMRGMVELTLVDGHRRDAKNATLLNDLGDKLIEKFGGSKFSTAANGVVVEVKVIFGEQPMKEGEDSILAEVKRLTEWHADVVLYYTEIIEIEVRRRTRTVRTTAEIARDLPSQWRAYRERMETWLREHYDQNNIPPESTNYEIEVDDDGDDRVEVVQILDGRGHGHEDPAGPYKISVLVARRNGLSPAEKRGARIMSISEFMETDELIEHFNIMSGDMPDWRRVKREYGRMMYLKRRAEELKAVEDEIGKIEGDKGGDES